MRRAAIYSTLSALTVAASLASSTAWSATELRANQVDKMSTMGQRAAAEVARIRQEAAAEVAPRAAVASATGEAAATADRETCLNQPRCPGGLRESAPGGQAEVSIAVDESGQHVVIGYNDTRGFNENPISLSGVLYSEDGGKLSSTAGELPSPGTDAIGTTRLPQVFGDPEVKYLGDCAFVYSSILVAKSCDTTAVQTMGVHRSTDCGKTWPGPFEMTAATNPNGIVEEDDARRRGRQGVHGRRSRHGPADHQLVELHAGGAGRCRDPHCVSRQRQDWRDADLVGGHHRRGDRRRRAVLDSAFRRGNNNAYVAWRRFPFPGTFFGLGNTVGFARSLDNGATWQAPIETATSSSRWTRCSATIA